MKKSAMAPQDDRCGGYRDKKTYDAPILVQYGALRDLTTGGTGFKTEQQNPGKGSKKKRP